MISQELLMSLQVGLIENFGQTIEINTFKQRQNKALHPTAYSSVRFGRKLPSLSPLPAAGELVVGAQRAAWLNAKDKSSVRAFREVWRFFVP